MLHKPTMLEDLVPWDAESTTAFACQFVAVWAQSPKQVCFAKRCRKTFLCCTRRENTIFLLWIFNSIASSLEGIEWQLSHRRLPWLSCTSQGKFWQWWSEQHVPFLTERPWKPSCIVFGPEDASMAVAGILRRQALIQMLHFQLPSILWWVIRKALLGKPKASPHSQQHEWHQFYGRFVCRFSLWADVLFWYNDAMSFVNETDLAHSFNATCPKFTLCLWPGIWSICVLVL